MKLHEAETEKFNIKQMKDLFEQKAAQLATEIVGKRNIKSRLLLERKRALNKQDCFTIFMLFAAVQISSHVMMKRRA